MIKVVVVGAGFGGVRATLELLKIQPQLHVTLVNNTSYHVYTPDLYEIITATVTKETKFGFEQLEGTTNIPLKKIFKDKNVSMIEDSLEQVLLDQNQILTTDKKNIEFDYLVLSLGSTTNFFNIEGAQNFSHPFKTTLDTLNCRNDIEELLRQKPKLEVVIVGGGLTGVELAGQLGFTKKVQVTLVEGESNLLPDQKRWIQNATMQRLKALGVNILTDYKISKVGPKKIETKEKKLEYDYLIWTGGISANNLNCSLNGALIGKNQLKIKGDLSLEADPNVFLIGDIAACFDQQGIITQATAWVAINQGRLVAKNIERKIKVQPTLDYVSPQTVFVAPIGGSYALSNFLGMHIRGLLGWIMKRGVALKYFVSILSLQDALKIWWAGVMVNFKEN